MNQLVAETRKECPFGRNRSMRGALQRAHCCLQLTIVPRGKELQHGLVEQVIQMARDKMVEAVQRIPAIEMIDAAGNKNTSKEESNIS